MIRNCFSDRFYILSNTSDSINLANWATGARDLISLSGTARRRNNAFAMVTHASSKPRSSVRILVQQDSPTRTVIASGRSAQLARASAGMPAGTRPCPAMANACQGCGIVTGLPAVSWRQSHALGIARRARSGAREKEVVSPKWNGSTVPRIESACPWMEQSALV